MICRNGEEKLIHEFIKMRHYAWTMGSNKETAVALAHSGVLNSEVIALCSNNITVLMCSMIPGYRVL